MTLQPQIYISCIITQCDVILQSAHIYKVTYITYVFMPPPDLIHHTDLHTDVQDLVI